MNCIYCGIGIVTARMARGGAEFTPHYARNGQFKCKECGPFNKADLNVNSPFSTGVNEVEFYGGNIAELTDQQLRALCRNAITEGMDDENG